MRQAPAVALVLLLPLIGCERAERAATAVKDLELVESRARVEAGAAEVKAKITATLRGQRILDVAVIDAPIGQASMEERRGKATEIALVTWDLYGAKHDVTLIQVRYVKRTPGFVLDFNESNGFRFTDEMLRAGTKQWAQRPTPAPLPFPSDPPRGE